MPWETPPRTVLSGNTAGTTNISGPIITIQGSNGVTLSGAAGNKIVVIGAAAATQTVAGSAAISAGSQSVSTGTVVFSDSHNVTFGMSGSSRITASASFPAQTVQSLGLYALGNTTGESTSTTLDARTLSLKGFGIASLGYSGGSVVVSVPAPVTSYRASNDAVGLNTAQTGVVWTVNSSGISFDAGAYLTTARRSTDAVGLNTAQTGVVWTVNSSGISFDAGAYLTTARRSTDAIGLNTAKTNVTWTVDSSGISLNAGGYAGTVTAVTSCAVTVNSGGVSVSVGPYLTTARGSTDAIGLNTAKTNVTWTVNSSGLSLDAGGYAGIVSGATNASVTVNTSGVSVNVPNTAVGTNTAQTNVTWTVNTSGISLNAGGYAGTVTGATNCSVTANTAGVSVSVKAPAVSYWENPRVDGLASWSGTSNSISVQRIIVPFQISATRADFVLSISGSVGGALSLRVNLGLYTGGASTLNSASTTSRGFTFQSTSAQSYSNWSGPRSVSIGLGTWNITPGEYFLAANFGWTTASTNTVSLNMYGNQSFVVSGAESGALGNITDFFRSGMVNNNAQSTLPNTMQLSGMTQTGAAAAQQPWFGFHGTF